MLESLKRIAIFLTLGLLMASAFFIERANFMNSHLRSIDEMVYYRMARRMNVAPFDYNTIPYARELTARGRELPAYFFKPLFKYPPLFTMLTARSMQLFGHHLLGAYYAALIAGILLIPLTYLLGALVFNRLTGILAAALVYLDPVTIICSQKIWMETSLVLFSLLSLYFFILALRTDKGLWFLFSGLACGLAANIKYPGVLMLPVYFGYAFFWQKGLFKNVMYWSSLFLPLVLLLPWAAWNIEVYGPAQAAAELLAHSTKAHMLETLAKLGVIGLLSAGLFAYLRARKYSLRQLADVLRGYMSSTRFRLILVAAFFIVLSPYWVKAIQLWHLPRVGWAMKMFYYEPPTFYFGQLLEFSLLFAAGYIALLLKDEGSDPGPRLIKATIWFNMIFYSIWGNFQSRYILICIPLLLILAAHLLQRTMARVEAEPSRRRFNLQLIALVVVVGYALIKTNYVNQMISYPNNLCFF